MVEIRRRLPQVGVAAAMATALWGLAVAAGLSGNGAREACLANLQRLAQVTLMYTADNGGRFPPHQEPMEPYPCQWGADNSNPYLQWPVVLSGYLPDRKAYLCPGLEGVRVGSGVLTRPNWIASERITTRSWPDGPCGSVWPPGWGGAITDSATQGRCTDPERFTATVGAAIASLGGRPVAEVESPEHHVMWADSSRFWLSLGSVLYANICRVDCADLKGRADWYNCPWSQACGAGGDFPTDARAQRAATRHEGGSNLAFVDGHAAWLSVPEMIAAYKDRRLLGVEPAPPAESRPWYLK